MSVLWDLPKDGIIECDYVSTNAQFRAESTPPVNESLFNRFIYELEGLWRIITVGKPRNSRHASQFRRASVSVMALARSGKVDFHEDEESRSERRVANRPPWQVRQLLTFVRTLSYKIRCTGEADIDFPTVLQVPRQTHPIHCNTKPEQAEHVAHRALNMLRRATFELYFSTEQAKQIVGTMPPGKPRVEAMVTIFSRITDPEYDSPQNTVQGYDTGSHVLAYRGFGRYDSCDIPEEKEEEETEPQNPKYKNQKSIERSLEQASAKASPEVLCPPL
jgi:hypothetical protein